MAYPVASGPDYRKFAMRCKLQEFLIGYKDFSRWADNASSTARAKSPKAADQRRPAAAGKPSAQLRIGNARFQKFDALSIKGHANAAFCNPSGETTPPRANRRATDESIDNKGISAVLIRLRADESLVLARNLL